MCFLRCLRTDGFVCIMRLSELKIQVEKKWCILRDTARSKFIKCIGYFPRFWSLCNTLFCEAISLTSVSLLSGCFQTIDNKN